MKVSVIGLGYIGLPTSIILASNGHQVYGFDVNQHVTDSLNSGQIHIKEPGLQEQYSSVFAIRSLEISTELKVADVYILAVPTPFIKGSNEQKKADLSYVEAATMSVAAILKPGDLVILESTSPPGTTKRVTDMLENKSGIPREQFHTAHCPERVLPGNMTYELKHNDRIIGSERRESAEKAKALYETFVSSGRIYLTDDVTAEMAKLTENTFRDVNIAFANELAEIAAQAGVDVKELITLANKHPRVNILTPGVGVGGHCIAVDPYFLMEAFEDASGLIAMARKINSEKPAKVAAKIKDKIGNDNSKTVVILGLAYKANIDDLRESPSIEVAKLLLSEGYHVVGVEPNSLLKVVDGIDNISLHKALEIGDLFVLALAHAEFMEQIVEIKSKPHLSFI